MTSFIIVLEGEYFGFHSVTSALFPPCREFRDNFNNAILALQQRISRLIHMRVSLLKFIYEDGIWCWFLLASKFPNKGMEKTKLKHVSQTVLGWVWKGCHVTKINISPKTTIMPRYLFNSITLQRKKSALYLVNGHYAPSIHGKRILKILDAFTLKITYMSIFLSI